TSLFLPYPPAAGVVMLPSCQWERDRPQAVAWNVVHPADRSRPPMTFLESVSSPDDLRALTLAECEVYAKEVREDLVAPVSRTGGHLGPNLGVVELTFALHRVFVSPKDTILLDVGHQSYVH